MKSNTPKRDKLAAGRAWSRSWSWGVQGAYGQELCSDMALGVGFERELLELADS